MKHQIYRAIPDFATHEGRTEYAHLIGLPDLPDYIPFERNRTLSAHDTKWIQERVQIARESYKDLNGRIGTVMKKYTQESMEALDVKKIKYHKACAVCGKTYIGAWHVCSICAHIFRSEKMIDKQV